jgi:Zn-dependent peptidase ImmA (M78 family)
MKNGSRQQLERLTKRLLLKHGVLSPPVPLERLVEQLGATLRIQSADAALRGFLVYGTKSGLKRNLIFVNAAHPRGTQRWILAHEIAHLLLAKHEIHIDWPDCPSRKDRSQTRESDHEETLADQLAGELLMPKHMLAADIEQPLDPHDDESLKRLASKYEVSLYALISRLEQVRLLRTQSPS